MNVIDSSSSPLDALPLNYVSFGVFTVVNYLWTWVAVITAAVSSWRIRTTSFSDKPDHQQQQPSIDRNTGGGGGGGSQVNPSANTYIVERQADSSSPSPIPALPSACDVKDVDGVTEGRKFTLYYHKEEEEEEERESDGGDVDGEETVVKEWRDDDDDDGVSCGEWWWERVRVRASLEDMGLYRHQDMTVVNGNVVRLWDEYRRTSEKDGGDGGGCCYNSLVIGLIN